MKKFLTVLLVIAVMFTFSFGSAFAAVPDADGSGVYVLKEAEVLQSIEDAYKLAQADLLETLNDAVDAVGFPAGKTTVTVDGLELTKADVEKIYKENVYDEAVKTLALKRQTALDEVNAAIASATDYNGNFVIPSGIDGASGTNADWNAAGYAAQQTKWASATNYFNGQVSQTSYDTVFKASTHAGTKAVALAKVAFERVRDAAKAAIQATDLTAYSKDYNGKPESNYDKAVNAVDAALKQIDLAEATATSAADWAGYKQGVSDVNTVYTAPVNQGSATGTFPAALKLIDKIADEPTAAAKLSYAQNKVLSYVTDKINAWKSGILTEQNNLLIEQSLATKPDQKKIDAANKLIADTNKQAAAAIEILTYLVKDCKDVDKLLSAVASTNDPFTSRGVTTTNWEFKDSTGYTLTVYNGTATPLNLKAVETADAINATTANDVMDVVNHIADLKDAAELAKASIGIDGTTAVEVEKALEDAIDETYKGAYAKLSTGDAIQALYNRQNALTGAAAVKVNNKEYKGVDAWDDDLSAYDEDYFDAVRKVVSEAKDAIKATATIADADAAFLAAYEKLDAVPTKSDKLAVQSTKEFKDLKKQYEDDLDVYIDYKEGLIGKGTVDYSWDKDEMLKQLKAELAKAYTVDALKTAYAEAKAEIDNLKNKAEMEKAAADLTARINALPTTATTADKATVEALRSDITDHNDYCVLIGDTLNDITLMTKLTNAEDAIKKAEIKAMKDAYDAIMKDGKVTTDEKAAVEALRADYDAFVAGYAGENATIADVEKLETLLTTTNGVNIEKAEELLSKALINEVSQMIVKLPADGSDPAAVKAARAAYDALSRDDKMTLYKTGYYDKLVDAEKMVNALTGVETLKLTAGSSAKKGSITVKWTVKGTGDRDGFQIWKSTKKNKGFKKAFTTTKTTYKNTKGLKAGTRYYYKVRAYQVVDGKNVYSDWSNKAIRIAK